MSDLGQRRGKTMRNSRIKQPCLGRLCCARRNTVHPDLLTADALIGSPLADQLPKLAPHGCPSNGFQFETKQTSAWICLNSVAVIVPVRPPGA